MSFDGFSDVEILKITTGRTRRPDGEKFLTRTNSDVLESSQFVVKLAKKIPCHTKVKQNIPKENDENQNKSEMVEISLTDPELADDIPVKDSESPHQTDTLTRSISAPLPAIHDVDKESRFQDYELQRKLMEEQNKMKRSLLQDAISKHAEKTQAEAKKLDEIKQALDILDSELSNDVSILRKQIETATIHFNQVEKQYCAIERSFLKAKQDLYHAHEKKEMLTEHLYTIIAHNEDRKARRLTELMEKVGLTLSENGT